MFREFVQPLLYSDERAWWQAVARGKKERTRRSKR
jgi:hypothetical protein